jgi:arginine/lysine/ornithine decarboxylase
MAIERLAGLLTREPRLDQGEAPVVDAIEAFLDAGMIPFTIPAHKQGRALDRIGMNVTDVADSQLETIRVVR